MKEKLLGVYDYTVILTYISFGIAMFGIYSAVSGSKLAAVVSLLLCGLCDGFDGKIARTKKNRTEAEKLFGIQIDSLCDLVCFGVLPCFIGYADGMRSPWYLLCYIPFSLSALIRLAYFNITEEERQSHESGGRKYYQGMPVTSTAVVFPIICVIDFFSPTAFVITMIIVYLLYSYLFISRIKVVKPGLRGTMIMIGVGLAEFIIFLVIRLLKG